jgi:hypothetical protein
VTNDGNVAGAGYAVHRSWVPSGCDFIHPGTHQSDLSCKSPNQDAGKQQ